VHLQFTSSGDCNDISTVDEEKDTTEHASLSDGACQWRSNQLQTVDADCQRPAPMQTTVGSKMAASIDSQTPQQHFLDAAFLY